MQSSKKPLSTGTIVGDKYRIVRSLGSGGNGHVYEAVNTWTERAVALKLLASSSRAATERAFQEARLAARIVHPNVVGVLDMGTDGDDGLFIVQELLDGESLAERLTRGALGPKEAAAIFLPVLDALAVAHAQRVVHRDVKPANIMLTHDTRGRVVPKLVDFGVALEVEEQGVTRVTLQGTLVGTPIYMAPEQIDDLEKLDARVDVWAVGVCLIEALTGQVPWKATSLVRLLDEIRRFDPETADLLPGAQPALLDAVRRALAPDREARFASAQEFLLAIQDLDWSGASPVFDSIAPPSRTSSEPPPTKRTRYSEPPLRLGLVVTSADIKLGEIGDALSLVFGRRTVARRFLHYSELVEAAGDGDVDLSWLPPVALVRARRIHSVVPLAQVQRAGGDSYASALLGRRGVVDSLGALPGRRAAWVDPWSAAGYLVPRWLLHERGHSPDAELASQGFVGGYDAVLAALRTGGADLGACYCSLDVAGGIARKSWSSLDPVTVLAVSQPIPGDAICASPLLESELAVRLRDALLAPEAARIVAPVLGASRFGRLDLTRYDGLDRALLLDAARAARPLAMVDA